MQVVAGGTASATAQPDYITGFYLLVYTHIYLRQVAIKCFQPVEVPYYHAVAIA